MMHLRIRRRALVLAAVLSLPAGFLGPRSVSALTYDGTNPGVTPCGDGSHTVYDLGARTAASPTGPEAIPTPIYSGSTQIGTVEIRHSAYCATVWARVKNLTGSSVQARETIYYWTDSNGTTGQFSQTETDTLSANGGTGWSHQYRDRASFQAKGEIYYAGAWRTAYTVRSVAWSQDAMPNGSGGTRDVSGDVTYILNAFTGVSAPSPNFYPEDRLLALLTFSSADLSANGWVAVTYRTGSPIYTSVQIVLSTASSWGSQNNTRAALCHEMDHAVGLNHVWYHNSAGIEVVGSKATCIGTSIPAGPSIDDVSALNAVYTNPAP